LTRRFGGETAHIHSGANAQACGIDARRYFLTVAWRHAGHVFNEINALDVCIFFEQVERNLRRIARGR
jgi:hypothetical protein